MNGYPVHAYLASSNSVRRPDLHLLFTVPHLGVLVFVVIVAHSCMVQSWGSLTLFFNYTMCNCTNKQWNPLQLGEAIPSASSCFSLLLLPDSWEPVKWMLSKHRNMSAVIYQIQLYFLPSFYFTHQNINERHGWTIYPRVSVKQQILNWK